MNIINRTINRTIKLLFIRSAVVGMLFLAYANDPIDMDIKVASAAAAPAVGGTFIVGDSTTWRLTGEYDNTFNLWNARHPDWTVDGVGGRNVTTLPARISYHLNNVDSSPSMFVMALGTNPAAEGSTWWKWNYEAALDLLPASTKVILVIPARMSRIGAEQRAKSDDVTRYAGYLHDIAAERTNVIVANWRSLAYNDPTRDPVTGIGEWTNDGVHQRNPHGRAKWMDILDQAVARF